MSVKVRGFLPPFDIKMAQPGDLFVLRNDMDTTYVLVTEEVELGERLALVLSGQPTKDSSKNPHLAYLRTLQGTFSALAGDRTVAPPLNSTPWTKMPIASPQLGQLAVGAGGEALIRAEGMRTAVWVDLNLGSVHASLINPPAIFEGWDFFVDIQGNPQRIFRG